MTPTHIPGKGEALVAAGDLPPNHRILRVAPFAAVPYGRFLDTLCSGCLQPCDASRRCSRCDVARHCALCASSLAGRAHAYECHALARLARNERGLTLHHDDLRLLLRVLSRRRLSHEDASSSASSGYPSGREEASFSTERDPERDPYTAAAADDSDVVVDDLEALDALMSGFDGDDDGELDERAVETLREVAKQCKFLVAAACRTSEETYARLLGKLQLNGFEITSAEATQADAAGDREDFYDAKWETARRRGDDDDDDEEKKKKKKKKRASRRRRRRARAVGRRRVPQRFSFQPQLRAKLRAEVRFLRVRRRGDHARDKKRGGAHDSVRGRVARRRDAKRASRARFFFSMRLRAMRRGTSESVETPQTVCGP